LQRSRLADLPVADVRASLTNIVQS